MTLPPTEISDLLNDFIIVADISKFHTLVSPNMVLDFLGITGIIRPPASFIYVKYY